MNGTYYLMFKEERRSLFMQTFNRGQQENLTQNPQVPPKFNHGGHELNDVHELLTDTVNIIDQYTLWSQQVQDPELKDIIQRQRQFMINEYNSLVQCFSSGQDPAMPTTPYKMKQGNNVTYGLTSVQPIQPIQSSAEINDRRISSQMLSSVKSAATRKSMAACEVTNPVVRRVIADSIPNCVEMAYEIFLYQNKNGYYPVVQYDQTTMEQLTSCFNTVTGMGGGTNQLQ